MEGPVDSWDALVILYIALGLMAVGFGWMIGGPKQARVVARRYYLDPVVWTARTITNAITHLLAAVTGQRAVVRPKKKKRK